MLLEPSYGTHRESQTSFSRTGDGEKTLILNAILDEEIKWKQRSAFFFQKKYISRRKLEAEMSIMGRPDLNLDDTRLNKFS